jgi:RTX calcium-binding nonapeptide repeat (4 copies)
VFWKNVPQRRRTALNVEQLEDRSLPAVSASLSGGALFIQGTVGNDAIVVRQIGDQLSVDGASIAVAGGAAASVAIAGVSTIVVLPLAGNDAVFLDVPGQVVTVPAMIFDNAGNNVIQGGAADDLIHGGPGVDRLFGNAGNDRIYGGGGSDRLFGEAGNDGLFGGATAPDLLVGGPGADRFLVQPGDMVADRTAADAILRFQNGTNAVWTDTEIEIADRAFRLLEQRTGNTAMLRDSTHFAPLTFVKGRNLGPDVLGDNADGPGGRTIDILDWPEWSASANDLMVSVFIHEISHNWDAPEEWAARGLPPSGIMAFRAISGWTPFNPLDGTRYALSDDGEWWYLRNAAFTDPYGQTNPHEDWAVTGEEYFWIYENFGLATVRDTGLPFQAKLNAYDAFLNELAARG